MTGFLGYSGIAALLPVSLLFYFLYGRTQTRAQAAVLAASYFLAASWGLSLGIATFFDTALLNGVLLWLSASLSFTFVFGVVWTRKHEKRRWMVILGTLIMSVPPFGIVGWASPLTAAGMMFPGTGFAGLLALILLIFFLGDARYWKIALPIALFFGLAGPLWGKTPLPPENWSSTQTDILYGAGPDDYDNQYRILKENAAHLRGKENRLVILPEGATGWSNRTSQRAWKSETEFTNTSVLGGAEKRLKSGQAENLMVYIDADNYQILYRQRMPVPVSMWRPWSKHGTRATFYETPVFDLDGQIVAPLICYEQLLIWPIIQSAVYNPDVIIGISNNWWASETNIPDIQKVTLLAWARLFNTKLAIGFNQ